jgi:hypothetical protein
MLLHLKHATAAQIENGPPLTSEVLDENVRDGAVFRVRPNEMIVAGLLPIFWGSGAGPQHGQQMVHRWSRRRVPTAAPRFGPASVAIIPSTAKPATLAITLHTDLFICWRRAHRVDISAA